MSNVSADEIVRLVARAFRLRPEQMRMVRREADRRMVPAAARDAAAYLIRRHTDASLTYTGRLLGISGGGASEVAKENLAQAARMLAECAEFVILIDRLENEIDALHEARRDPDHVSAGAAHRMAEVML